MALTAAHINAGVVSGGDSVAIGIQAPSPPHQYPVPHIFLVSNKPYGFCGRQAPCLLTYLLTITTTGLYRFFYLILARDHIVEMDYVNQPGIR